MLVSSTKINSNYRNSQPKKQTQNLNFGISPEYVNLNRKFPLLRYSFPFRTNCDLKDIVNTVKLAYQKEKQPRFIIIGLGKGQELLSLISCIKSVFPSNKLEKIVDIDCVDLQPRLSEQEFQKSTKILRDIAFLPESIKKTIYRCEDESDKYVRHTFSQDVIDIASNILYKGDKTMWDTHAEDFTALCEPEKYDLLLINNVLMYINDNNPKKAKLIPNCGRILKTGGFLNTESESDYTNIKNADFWRVHITPYLQSNFKKMFYDIWQKLK